MKLSIIVTIYNKEQYIRECIASIINQNGDLFKDIELIIVNDGSKDNSIENIKDYILNYPNIKLINKENEGLSLARNDGLKSAKGDYIWFVDGDDCISNESLTILLPYLNGKSDLIKIYSITRNDKCDVQSNIQYNCPKTFSGLESYYNNTAQNSQSVLLIYRKKYLKENNLYFMPKVLHEDYEFCPRVCYLSKTTTVLPCYLYYIRRTINDGHQSITNTINPKRSFDILVCSKSLYNFNYNIVAEKHVQKVINIWIAEAINSALYNILQSSKEEIVRFDKIYFEEYRFFNSCFLKGNLKYKIEGILFNIFPKRITNVYAFLNLFTLKK